MRLKFRLRRRTISLCGWTTSGSGTTRTECREDIRRSTLPCGGRRRMERDPSSLRTELAGTARITAIGSTGSLTKAKGVGTNCASPSTDSEFRFGSTASLCWTIPIISKNTSRLGARAVVSPSEDVPSSCSRFATVRFPRLGPVRGRWQTSGRAVLKLEKLVTGIRAAQDSRSSTMSRRASCTDIGEAIDCI